MTDNTNDADTESQLFEKCDVHTVPLVEYIRWFIDSSYPRHNLAQLPPIQRGAVWKVAQVERLWDSLLRGFPIGSFLLAPRCKGDAARSTESREQMSSESAGWFLLDGQQRTRSLLLGFRPSDSARLWIDLAPPPVFDNADHNDRMFLFRLLTSAQPWGMEWNDSDARLSENTKYGHRKALLGERHYDYEVKLDLSPLDLNGDWRPDSKTAWPLRAGLPVPFDALVALCGGYIGPFVRPAWEAVERLVHPQSKGLMSKDDVCAHLDSLLDALEAVLHGGNKRRQTVATLLRLDPQEDPFLKRLPSINAAQAEKMPDAIEVLFQRANSGGTILAGEEMTYSLLKARWDDAYPLVDKVVQDKKVGYLLPPSSLVLSAARLALFEVPVIDGKWRRDVAQPSVRDFRRWIGEPGTRPNEDGPFLTAMKSLLQPVDTDRGDAPARFHAALARLCGLVLYRDAHCGTLDPGLPRKLLLSVNPLMLHPVLYWLDQHRKNDSAALEKSRLPLLRYLVFSLLGLLDVTKTSLYAKASRYAIAILRQRVYAVFPDHLIYQRWCTPGKDDGNGREQDPVVLSLPTPDQLAAPFAEPVDGLLRDWDALFGDSHGEFRRRFWTEGPHSRRRDLLLWFQRQYLPRWFEGYNPMREDGADKPYDEDHILARAHLSKQGTTLSAPDHFNDQRWHYLDSLGNLRIWPLWANRSDGKKCPAEKLRLVRLNAGDKCLIASSIDLADRQLWLDASGEPFKWPKKRRVAWQTAVERRTAWLYRTLYNTLGYSNW